MANRKLDARELWVKLLDPIRPDYKVDSPNDLEILLRLVHDHQSFVRDIAEMSGIIEAQGKALRAAGLAGY